MAQFYWDCHMAAVQCIIWPEMESNTLYYGDNLPVLRDREHFPDACIDLIYLDPPFNSNRSYNVLFKEAGSTSSPAQIEAFEDTWHWGKVAQGTFEEIALHGADSTARLLKAMVDALGHNDVTAYLTMMAVRLVELRRVLKPTGSIYLHCDPSASHYLKMLMDSIFGPKSFQNEIIWKRSQAHSSSKRYGPVHDTLLYYAKGDPHLWNPQPQNYSPEYVESHYHYVDENGRRYKRGDPTGSGVRHGETGKPWRGIDPTPKNRHWIRRPAEMDLLDQEGRIYWPKKPGAWPYIKLYLDDMLGVVLQDVWTDIDPVNPVAKERLGYPTQKPLALLERIITASSNPDDVVLDPFCGCGTAVHAAHKLGRRWIGIDITYLAIGLIRRRMEDAFPGISINEVGVPADLPGAEALAAHDPYQFQFWAIDRLGAQPVSGQHKRGADRGIDGVIPFVEGATNLKRVIVSVKAGHIEPAYVQQLKGVMEGQDAPMGVLVTLREPTRAMRTEAVSSGSYHSDFWNRDYPRIQLIAASELLAGKRVEMPPQVSPFSQAAREAERGEQTSLI